ncbi:MAG TPA: proton-conducting transporter membrane subunit [Candidatus Lokiarchaeia archaeon]|nr:proton-conducting transporter membrane subunit [Candidatus Lokiarchaeia archaeon]
MTVTLLDVTLPIITLVILSVLTIPVVGFIRKRQHGNKILMVAWYLFVYVLAILTVINLAWQYYNASSAESMIITLSPTPTTYTLTSTTPPIFSSAFLVDPISIYMAVLFVVISAIVFLYAMSAINFREKPAERYFAVMLIVTACLIGAILAGDLLTLFIFWEGSAGAVSFLILYEKTPESIRATMKYLVMIIIASSLIVYGLSIIFGICGSLNYWTVAQYIGTVPDKSLFIFAFVLVTAGYATEAAVVPFHSWLLDAYAAAPASSAAFIASLIDQGSYYIILRVFVYILKPASSGINWQLTVAILSTITMIVANLAALAERNVKRLFAYICIADVGYNLIAITSVDKEGIQGNLFFFLAGGITIALAFMCVGIFNSMGIKTLNDFRGIGRKMPYTSLALVIGTLSFAGFPPMAGFIAKYLVFTAAIHASFVWLAVIGVCTSVIQACYLIILYTDMFAKEPTIKEHIKEPRKLLVPIYVLLAAIFIFGIFPQIVLNFIVPVVNQFFAISW